MRGNNISSCNLFLRKRKSFVWPFFNIKGTEEYWFSTEINPVVPVVCVRQVWSNEENKVPAIKFFETKKLSTSSSPSSTLISLNFSQRCLWKIKIKNNISPWTPTTWLRLTHRSDEWNKILDQLPKIRRQQKKSLIFIQTTDFKYFSQFVRQPKTLSFSRTNRKTDFTLNCTIIPQSQAD